MNTRNFLLGVILLGIFAGPAGIFGSQRVLGSTTDDTAPLANAKKSNVEGLAENHETIFFNGQVLTLDSSDTVAEAILSRNGRIVKVGSNDEVKSAASKTAAQVDLQGKTVLPGLIDSHAHLWVTARAYYRYMDGRAQDHRTIANLLESIKKRAAETPKGEWIIVVGGHKFAEKIKEGRTPTKEELDTAAPKHPLVMLDTYHRLIFNSYALNLYGITKDSDGKADGQLERDPVTGEPTGACVECAAVFPDYYFTHHELKGDLKGLMEKWVENGFTSVQSFSSNTELRALQALLREMGGTLPLRVKSATYSSRNPAQLIKKLVSLGIEPGLGNDWLNFGLTKIWTDGMLITNTSATLETYTNDPHSHGHLLVEPERLNEMVSMAHDAGIQLGIHATGDKAQAIALDAIEAALKKNPKAHRHRIEHFGCDMGSPELRRRARELGVIPNVTGAWLYTSGDYIEDHIGSSRAAESFALRSMFDEGLKPANSTDSTGIEKVQMDPFFSMWTLVTRETYFGKKFMPQEAITIKEALHMWTTHAAYANNEEDVKGSIELGKFSDFIVISDDILKVPASKIKDIKVDKTIIGGKIVYERD